MSRTDAERPGDLPPGVFVEIGGERVHLVESGPSDAPPVLLTSGLGGAWFDWECVTDLLAGHRVLCFDRPGTGLSPAARSRPSLRREVRLLAGLARWAGRPVVVVAHSMAGFQAEALARVHPELVRGLVLVDPSFEASPWSDVRISAALQPGLRLAGRAAGLTRVPWLTAPRARRSLLRFISRRKPPVPDGLVRAVYGRGTVLGTILAENAAYREMAADVIALRRRRPFPPVPLVVLTALADMGDGQKAKAWAEDHRELAAMSPYGRQVDLPDSLHLVQVDRPDVVAEAVREVLAVEGPER
ncbi:alpha/beta fold hydrolase [Thermomonospora umbrina]|uniref:Pimeloyl-ACP methyl ester carboxylesterase n=1 Tax=Thermomonospora umbrina TaxID=111806 RepID=A0A3D9SK94_9ACTN|nr:alpha/beta hydrolase [Thermomonospora umbrina]REE96319.1 pimeloyl-ACP methyl ester carboxylesterase [Thermomonospora umbrina]